jgi:hypothetical protein
MKSKVLKVFAAGKNKKKRISLTLALATIAVGTLVLGVSADAPPGPYFNGFETDTAGWFNFSGATITRVASGDTSAAYASGVSAASGNYYARLGIDPSPDSCTFGGGTAPIYYGPYTKWGGYSGIFPPGGYSTGVDIYLDVPYAQLHPDTRFDWSSAINDTAGNHRRDFVFNVGTDALGFVISGGNNATRCGANPADPGHTPVHITQSGWYTFKHTFSGVSGGPLTVTLTVAPSGSNVPLGTWVRSDPSDIIGTTVGGNRYGWFVQNEFDGLAIDNSFRTGIMSTPGCSITITNGGWFIANNGDRATFGGNAMVSLEGDAQGQEEYQDHGPAQAMTVNSISVVAVQCSDDHTSASIFGLASVDGTGAFEYEIDVSDAGEPGRGDTYRIRIPGLYDSGQHSLLGGNIQIR